MKTCTVESKYDIEIEKRFSFAVSQCFFIPDAYYRHKEAMGLIMTSRSQFEILEPIIDPSVVSGK